MQELLSHGAVFRTDAVGRIRAWNPAAERLTGVESCDAVGRRCWEIVGGRAPDGATVCHPGCAAGRLARTGRPVPCPALVMRTPSGPKRLEISAIVLRDGADVQVLHPMREAPETALPRAARNGDRHLTPRQREILLLLADGVRVAEIARRLTISEATVRNHVRAILLELGVHSQLEAVARARTLALVVDDDDAA